MIWIRCCHSQNLKQYHYLRIQLQPILTIVNILPTSEYNADLIVNRTPFLMNFTFWMFCRFPKLRLLDFRKIRQKDRQAANELFKSKQGKELLKEIAKKAKAAAANPAASESNNSKGNAFHLHEFHYSVWHLNSFEFQCSTNIKSRRCTKDSRCYQKCNIFARG